MAYCGACLDCEAVVSRAAGVEGESSGRALSRENVDVAIERWQKWGEHHFDPLLTTASHPPSLKLRRTRARQRSTVPAAPRIID